MSSTAAGGTLDVSALLNRGMTPFHWRLLLISCLVTFFDGLDYSLISFTLPYLRDEMALTDEMTGFVSSAAFAGQMVGSLIGSFIADMIGRRPDRKSTRLNSSHLVISYAVFCLKQKSE